MVNESSVLAVLRSTEDAVIVTWYVVEAARPCNLTSCRVPSVLTASQSTGSTPSGPHCTVPVDGSDVVHATEAA